jgi:hypothetical protein
VLAGLRHTRVSLPRTDLAGLRKWLATTDVSVSITAEALFALAEESTEKTPLYFDKARIVAFFKRWNELGRPVSSEGWAEFADLVESLCVDEPK